MCTKVMYPIQGLILARYPLFSILQDVMPAMFCYGLCHMSIQEFTECFQTLKKVRLCAVMSMWLVHIKEHVWSVGTCPTTILLSMSRSMCKVLHWRAEQKKGYGLA